MPELSFLSQLQKERLQKLIRVGTCPRIVKTHLPHLQLHHFYPQHYPHWQHTATSINSHAWGILAHSA